MTEQFESDREFAMTLNARSMWAAFASTGAKKKGGGKWSLHDFLPTMRRKKQPTPRPPEDLLAMAKHLNAMWGGQDQTPKR